VESECRQQGDEEDESESRWCAVEEHTSNNWPVLQGTKAHATNFVRRDETVVLPFSADCRISFEPGRIGKSTPVEAHMFMFAGVKVFAGRDVVGA